MTKKYAAIVIGAGQSGPPLAERLTKEGLTTAVIERKLLGGTCVNTGCIPTKTLIASARAAHMARRAVDFGVVDPGPIEVDMKRVKARKDDVVRESSQGVTEWLETMQGCTLYRGHARFEGPNVVRVGDELLAADRIFINTGARAMIPDMPGLDEVDYLTNSTIMEVDFLPEHLVIVGGSYVGLEFAQMYRRFGSRVTVVEKSERLISRDDADISAAVREILEHEGIELRTDAECIAARRHGDGIAISVDCRSGAPEVVGSHLLLAVGRRPNSDDLGLEKAGIETDERGYIRVDDQLRTNVAGVWATGDVNGRGAFTHTSWNDYEIVAANLFDGDSRRVSDRIMAYALYIDPPLGRVGMTEREVRDRGRAALMGKMPMSRVGRARERSETQGFMKVLVDAGTLEILGAAVLGIRGDEVVHSLLDVMYAGAPCTTIQRAMHIHPTVTELVPTLLGELEALE
jgi:pyruvate/2-oxoglutarate dehydrogenase complex dihydrolipoamide dehydrogenase (E3) component